MLDPTGILGLQVTLNTALKRMGGGRGGGRDRFYAFKVWFYDKSEIVN